MVVNHVVKGMLAVTFEIGVNLFQSTLGVVIIRGKNGGGSPDALKLPRLVERKKRIRCI